VDPVSLYVRREQSVKANKKRDVVTCIEMSIISGVLAKHFNIMPFDDDFIGAASQLMAIGRGLAAPLEEK
jgi:hypothetical protein